MHNNMIAARKCGATAAAFPIVATALAGKLGIKIVWGSSPKTDGETIYLPTPDSRNYHDEEMTLLWGLLDHEIGHVRETAMSVFADAAEESGELKEMLNILEDVRSEQITGSTFPGAALNLNALTRILVTRSQFCAAPAHAGVYARGQAYTLHALRARVLCQDALAPLAQQDRAGLPPALADELDQLLAWRIAPESTAATLDLARQVHNLLAQAQAQAQAEAAKGSQSDAQSRSDDSPDSDDEPADDSQAWQHPIIAAGGLGEVIASSLPQGSRDPQLATSEPLWSAEHQSDASLVRRLGRQLTQAIREPIQAQTIARTRLGLRGPNLVPNQLHRIGTGDGRVFRARRPDRKPDTAVAIALDVSGSMMPGWSKSAQAMLTAIHGISAIDGIKAGVLVFPTMSWIARIGAPLPRSIRQGRLPAPEGTSTPTGKALTECGKALALRHEPRKVLVCITDGDPNRPVDEVCAALRALNVQTIGIGIGADVKTLPMDRWVEIKRAEELRKVLGRALREVALT